MVQNCFFYRSESFDPYENLATEYCLLQALSPGEAGFYLWQNRRTVVVGKNQDCWRECDVAGLEQDGGHLARRLSGGGAVYHDLGNLNFTFFLRREDYDVRRQLAVICGALAEFGIPAEISGRNDLVIAAASPKGAGRKFSGNAFLRQKEQCYHHGTLMVAVEPEPLQRYLRPSKAKLAAKGVDSVRSRTINLRELVSDLTTEALCEALAASFRREYGDYRVLDDSAPIFRERGAQRARFAAAEWKYGSREVCDYSRGQRYDWGEAEVRLCVAEGQVARCVIVSDAMEGDLITALAGAIEGCAFQRDALAAALTSCGETAAERRIAYDVQELLWSIRSEE